MTQFPSADEAVKHLRSLPLVGNRIVEVDYLVSAGSAWPDGRESGRIHEVDHGVKFTMADGSRLQMRWEMEGEYELLAVDFSAHVEPDSGGLIDAFEVSATPEWMRFVERTVVSLGVARHVLAVDAPEPLWAVRFDFEGNESVVIALGEVRGGRLAYLPDAVVVLFDERDAQTYSHQGSRGSSWGEAVSRE